MGMLALCLFVGFALIMGVANVVQTATFGWSDGSSLNVGATCSIVGESDQRLTLQIAGTTTNQAWLVNLISGKLQYLIITTDQPLTLKTNNSGSPQDTIALAANIPFVWIVNSGIPFPFAGTVTEFFLSNAGSTAANVFVRSLSTSP